MVNCEKLTMAGIDMTSLLKRLMGNEALVGLFIRKFTQDRTFDQLKLALANRDSQQAELTSHTLKGMCGNLSLTELYALFTRQVTLIRSDDLDGAIAMMDELTPLYDHAISQMREWLAEQ